MGIHERLETPQDTISETVKSREIFYHKLAPTFIQMITQTTVVITHAHSTDHRNFGHIGIPTSHYLSVLHEPEPKTNVLLLPFLRITFLFQCSHYSQLAIDVKLPNQRLDSA